MKTRVFEEGRPNVFPRKSTLKIKTALITSYLLTLMLSSCYVEPWYGHDGRPGVAYLSITWIDDEPAYINTGTSAIPQYFYWDKYYRANPGYYTMYYEGDYWNGYNWAFYAWEIDYEIWRANGEPGGLYHNGANGPDTYFTLECSPFGPYVYEDLKSAPANVDFEILQESEDEITILKSDKDFHLKATYRKVESRNEDNKTLSDQ